MRPPLRILVVSDLHIHQSPPTDADSPSYLSALPEFRGPKINPIEGIVPLLKGSDHGKIDWIVCGGDIGNKGDSVSAAAAWTMLESLRKRLGAKKLIGTVGNHDVDSRRTLAGQRPDQGLKDLAPGFPISDRNLAARFWANDYVFWRDAKADTTLLIVNTCTLHGVAVPKDREAEYNRGFVPMPLINKVANEAPGKLSSRNILLMHHHIRQHPWVTGDVSHAVNGPQLLDVLKDSAGSWFVIHGHQHLPNISYGDGSPDAPIVLSAGSLAAKTYPVRGRSPRNQLYLVEIGHSENDAPRSSLRGRVFAWNWTPSMGWVEAPAESGLARVSGFGHRGGLPHLAAEVHRELASAPGGYLAWKNLVERIDALQFLLREDLDSLVQLLARNNVSVHYDFFQCPSMLQKT